VHLTGGCDRVAEVTPEAITDLGLREGDEVWATCKATDVVAYPD